MEKCWFCKRSKEEALKDYTNLPPEIRRSLDKIFKKELPFPVCAFCYSLMLLMIGHAIEQKHLVLRGRFKEGRLVLREPASGEV